MGGKKMHLQWKLRDCLKKNPEGLEIADLVKLTGADKWSVRNSLRLMPDAYIDRWHKEPRTRGRYASVWCVVDVPENCPMPTKTDA